jgi:hypothetical protein
MSAKRLDNLAVEMNKLGVMSPLSAFYFFSNERDKVPFVVTACDTEVKLLIIRVLNGGKITISIKLKEKTLCKITDIQLRDGSWVGTVYVEPTYRQLVLASVIARLCRVDKLVCGDVSLTVLKRLAGEAGPMEMAGYTLPKDTLEAIVSLRTMSLRRFLACTNRATLFMMMDVYDAYLDCPLSKFLAHCLEQEDGFVTEILREIRAILVNTMCTDDKVKAVLTRVAACKLWKTLSEQDMEVAFSLPWE